jgi:hypothetical protein
MSIIPDSLTDVLDAISNGSVVDRAQGGVHEEIDHVHDKALDLIETTTAEVQRVLDSNLNTLDIKSQNLTLGLSGSLEDLNDNIDQRIDQAQDLLTDSTQTTHNRVGELVAQLEDSLVDLEATVRRPLDHIVDRLAWNAITVGAILLLLLGLIVIVAAAIAAKGWPGGFAGFIVGLLGLVFVAGGVALGFVPAAKGLALRFLLKESPVPNIPPTPEIFNLDPDPVAIDGSADTEVRVHGVHLTPGGVRPAATIGGVSVEIRGAGNYEITVALPKPGLTHLQQPGGPGYHIVTTQLALAYLGNITVGCPIRLKLGEAAADPEPARLTLGDLYFTNDQPTARLDFVHAMITITNGGQAPSKPFQLIWQPIPGGHQIAATIPPIKAGTPLAFTFPEGYVYMSPGTFTSEVVSKSSEMSTNAPYADRTITVNGVVGVAPERKSETFKVTAIAAGDLASPQTTDINFVFTVQDGWQIDRSKGDSAHEGISEIHDNDNTWSKALLSAYNYYPESETTVRVVGQIHGTGLCSDGKSHNYEFDRTYQVFILKYPKA